MNKILNGSLIIFISLALITSCKQKDSHIKGSAEHFTLASASVNVGSLVYFAEKLGYFKDSGLNVTITNYEAGKLSTDALLAGKADISVGSDFVFVSNSFDNTDLRIIGTIAVARDCKLIARKDRGIKKPEDLKGKKIGITRKSSGEFYLGRFLTFNKLSINDVKIINLKPSSIIKAITGGTIDAALTWEPYIYNIKKRLTGNVIIWPGQSGQDFYFLLIAMKDWLKSHSSEVNSLLEIFIRTENYVKNNDKTAREFLKIKYKYSTDYINYVWKELKFTVKLPQALLLVMEDQALWRIENKLTDKKKIPNYLNYISLDGLGTLKPEAVTIIR